MIIEMVKYSDHTAPLARAWLGNTYLRSHGMASQHQNRGSSQGFHSLHRLLLFISTLSIKHKYDHARLEKLRYLSGGSPAILLQSMR
jgi:hypothetical protein